MIPTAENNDSSMLASAGVAAEAPAITWARTRADMAADRHRLRMVLGCRTGLFRRGPFFHRGLWALRLYRLSYWMFHRRGLRFAARLVWALNLILTRADLDPGGMIGPGAVIADPYGVILHGEIGPGCTIGRCAGVGGLFRGKTPLPNMHGNRPAVAEDVVLGAEVMVLGSVSVGRGAQIGEGCSVMDSIPAGARVEAREAAWRAIRVAQYQRPRPPTKVETGLLGCIRDDLRRAVWECSGRADVGTLRLWGHLLLPGVSGVALFRVAQALHGAGWRRAGALVARLVHLVTGMMLHPGSVIGPGFFVAHPVGVRFCGTAGPNLALYPHSKVGPLVWPRLTEAIPADAPVFGKDSLVGAQGEVVGAVRIGDGAAVGVRVRVNRDLAPGLVAVARSNWHLVAVPQPA